MEYEHVSVMPTEVLQALRPEDGERYADGTIGGGGHAAMILEAGKTGSWIGGSDRDKAAVEAASSRLAPFAGRFEIRKGSFASLADWIEPRSLDGVLLDLGVSSPQLDRSDRGFSLLQDGPLDMRMDVEQPMTAANIVNDEIEEKLADIIWRLGGERKSRKIAKAIVRAREQNEIRTTRELADIVETVKPRRGKKTHPATKVFQALRIEVNDEFGELNRGLKAVTSLLKEGGRLAVITFHSGEDRIVKDYGREETRDYDVPGEEDVPALRIERPPRMRWVNRKAICATEEELAANPRARSAQLRVLEKLNA
jgi:16S rRNA (cytosine1402-N4)-methyltransferase|tara:strand:+ start:690 stop:1622 length:933 start_codon:yes stop_codon:yes gene_type:complete